MINKVCKILIQIVNKRKIKLDVKIKRSLKLTGKVLQGLSRTETRSIAKYGLIIIIT